MSALRCALLALLALTLGGCGSYSLKGRVIAGDVSYIAVVDADDPAMESAGGVAGAMVTLSNDPDRLSREVVGTGVSGQDGEFSVPFDKIGGGFLEYDVGVRVRRPGYRDAEHYFLLPGSGKRLLVVLAPGRGAGSEVAEDPYETYKRYRGP